MISGGPCETPLLDLLRSVPEDGRHMYEHHSTHHQNVPYGHLCKRAAFALEQAQIKAAQQLEMQNALVRLRDEQKQRIEQFTDALDHIMRVYRNTDVQTKRLLWIEKRAQCAIEGSEDWREYDYPKVRKAAKENGELRERIEQLEAAFGRLLMQLANNTKVAVKMFDEIIEAKQVLETAGESTPQYECPWCPREKLEVVPVGLWCPDCDQHFEVCPECKGHGGPGSLAGYSPCRDCDDNLLLEIPDPAKSGSDGDSKPLDYRKARGCLADPETVPGSES